MRKLDKGNQFDAAIILFEDFLELFKKLKSFTPEQLCNFIDSGELKNKHILVHTNDAGINFEKAIFVDQQLVAVKIVMHVEKNNDERIN